MAQGHQELFKRSVKKTGQVIIQVRDVKGSSGGEGQDDNPFSWEDVCKNIEENLLKDGYERGKECNNACAKCNQRNLSAEELVMYLKKNHSMKKYLP